MNRSYLLIGGNIGDRNANIEKTRLLIEKKAGPIEKSSAVYETAAWGITDQPAFLNQVLLIETKLQADQLLEELLLIETELGRKREVKFGPRIIDIDILFFNEEIIKNDLLIVPHPEIQNRRFALVPMNEIASLFIHPVFNKTMNELLQGCEDMLEVTKVC